MANAQRSARFFAAQREMDRLLEEFDRQSANDAPPSVLNALYVQLINCIAAMAEAA